MQKPVIVEKEKLEKAVANALKVVDKYLPKFGRAFPMNGERDNNCYQVSENDSWISGFWPGILWLAYIAGGAEKYKERAMQLLPSFELRINHKIYLDHHDLGFLYSLSCVSCYKLTGDSVARESAIKAAEHLIKRFVEKGQYIKAWGAMEKKDGWSYIIDSLVNLPLLYWATEETGDSKYRDIALKHLSTVMANSIRSDGSTPHRVYFDEEGNVTGSGTVQGYSDESCWSRGQSWSVLGLALSYGATGDDKVLEAFKKVSKYFIEHLPQDNVPFWDFVFSDGDEEPRDSSAGAICVCGILEILRYLPEGDADREYYINAARNILNSLIDNYSSDASDGGDGLIRHCTGSKPHGGAVDTCAIYADYFYLEALTRCLCDWDSFWC